MADTAERTLVILAAGVGSRYGGLKQLAPVGPRGEALLEYSIYDGLRTGVTRVVLVVRSETEALFRDRLSALGARIPLIYAHQALDDLPDGHRPPAARAKPWGTVHAVLAASPGIEGSFIVLNADDFYGLHAFEQVAAFSSDDVEGCAGAVVGFEVQQTLSEAGPVSRALCRTDPSGRLSAIKEIKKVWRSAEGIVYLDSEGRRSSLAGREPVSMNMWLLPKEALTGLSRQFSHFLETELEVLGAECLLPDEIQQLTRSGDLRIQVLRGGGPWCGLTFPEDEARTRDLLKELTDQGIYPAPLWD